jgi:hypothetical protein
MLLAALVLLQTVPDWAQPGSATHVQVAPPADFHRPTKTYNAPIGIFEGQSDVGSALVPAAASHSAGAYTITSAGYNIWYTRDEFRYLWKKLPGGDVSLAANIAFPDPDGYGDRKAVLVIREDLEDDSKEAIAALHGLGMIHIAYRPEKGVRVKDIEFRAGGRGSRPGGKSPDSLVNIMAQRIGIEKRGDSFALYVSLDGEPMHQFGPPITLHLDGPYYAGIGFCSHLPDKVDSAVLSNVMLENAAGKVR